jgi:hypothetical protein
MSRKLLVGGAVLCVTFLGGVGARAVTSQYLIADGNAIHVSGVACRPRKADVSKTTYTDTSIVNEANTSAQVVCPVQLQVSALGEFPADMAVYVRDRSTSANISCTLFVTDGESPGTIFQETGTSTGSNGAIHRIAGPDGNFDLQSWSDLELYTMRCTLPLASSSSTRSEIVDYRISLF